MINLENSGSDLAEHGFTILPKIYSSEELEQIQQAIEQADSSSDIFRKTTNLFAIRQFLKAVPNAVGLIMNAQLKAIIHELFGHDYFVVKSIYFDKPETSNWFVSYHQDLTISVDKKIALEGFSP